MTKAVVRHDRGLPLLTEVTDGRICETPNAVSTIVVGALAEIPQAAAVGLAVLDASGTVRTLEASSPVLEGLHTSQFRLGEGPCLDALPGLGPATGEPTFAHVSDLDTDDRWPRWSEEVRAAGYREVLSFPMTGTCGYVALTFYASSARSLRPRDVRVGAVFADHLGDLLGVSGGHETHLASSRALHHATGILAERYDLVPGQAFGLLVAIARDTGRTLPTAAQAVTADLAIHTKDRSKTMSDSNTGNTGARDTTDESGAENRGPANIPEQAASSESELALSEQVAQRESDD